MLIVDLSTESKIVRCQRQRRKKNDKELPYSIFSRFEHSSNNAPPPNVYVKYVKANGLIHKRLARHVIIMLPIGSLTLLRAHSTRGCGSD